MILQVPAIESHLPHVAQTVCSNVPDVLTVGGVSSRLCSFSCVYSNVEGLRQGLAGAPLFGKRQRAGCAKQPRDSLRETPPPPPEAAGGQFVRQPDADPFRPAGCHLAEELKSLEEPFFPDLRISELATCSGRRMRGRRREGGGKGAVAAA